MKPEILTYWRNLVIGGNWVPTGCQRSQFVPPLRPWALSSLWRNMNANGDKWWQMVMATKDAFGCTGHCPRALWGEGRAPTVHVIDAFSYIDEFILSLMPVSSPRDPQDQIMLILTIYSESTPVLEFFPIAIAGVPRDSERMVAIRRIRPNQHLLGLHAAQQIIRRFHGGSAVPGVGFWLRGVTDWNIFGNQVIRGSNSSYVLGLSTSIYAWVWSVSFVLQTLIHTWHYLAAQPNSVCVGLWHGLDQFAVNGCKAHSQWFTVRSELQHVRTVWWSDLWAAV